ncbi:MAG: TonB-dependent receptor [Pseudomonadota bacterium]
MFHNRESAQQGAPTGTFWGAFVPPTHPDSPFGIDLCATTTGCSGPQPVIAVRRASEVGSRTFNQDADSYRLGFALAGERGDLNWRLSADTAKWDETQVDTGKSLRGRVDTMLNPAACAADADCPGLWNPFVSDSLTAAQIEWAYTDIRSVIEGELTTIGFDIGAPFNFGDSTNSAAWHAGFEQREQSATVTPDPQAAAGTVWGVPGSATDGSFSVTELYGEVYLPVSDDLDIEASLRFTDYDYLDADTIFKFAAHYQPVENAGLSIVYAEGFRGPNIDELFLGDQTTAAIYTDPCDNFGTNQSNATIIANCQADGLATDIDLSSAQATSLEGGNSALTPEESESLTLSLVLNPTDTMSVQLDYYQIDISNAISRVGVSTIVNRCYSSTGFSDPFCAFIVGPSDPAIDETPSPTAPARRNAAGQISGVILSLANFASFETSGLDVTFANEWDTRWGQVTTEVVASHLSDYTFTAVAGEQALDLAGQFGPDPFHGDISAAFPEWQLNSRVTLTRERWTSSLTTRWLSEVDDLNAATGNLGAKANAVTYFDWQTAFSIEDIDLRVGVRNLTDEQPPYVTNYTDVNTLPLTYDLAGRYFYLQAGFTL